MNFSTFMDQQVDAYLTLAGEDPSVAIPKSIMEYHFRRCAYLLQQQPASPQQFNDTDDDDIIPVTPSPSGRMSTGSPSTRLDNLSLQ